MLAPIDKLNAGGNDTIQILVTRACDLHHCSNCTQLLPYRNDDTVHMDLDVFREACESLVGWADAGGIVGVFGGNPCVHADFPGLCAILSDIIPPRNRGLWTNNLNGHGAVAAETFRAGRLNLNAHAVDTAAAEMDEYFPGRVIESSRTNASWHSPILMDWRDYDIAEWEWHALREACDINQRWSGAVMQKTDPVTGEQAAFAYFCEVAGALDGVRGVNHGVRVFPGWWQHDMKTFEHQVKACCDEGCGVPLSRLGHLDRDNTYDVSRSWVKLTIGAKPQRKHDLHDKLPGGTEMATDYQSRFTTDKPPPEG